MHENELEKSSGTDGLPVAPSLGPILESARTPVASTVVEGRTLVICAISIVLAVAAAMIAQWLMDLIGLVTNLSFFGVWSAHLSSPAANHLGLWVIAIPPAGGLVVGL